MPAFALTRQSHGETAPGWGIAEGREVAHIDTGF